MFGFTAGYGRKKALRLPSGEMINPRAASAQIIEHAAVEVRRSEAAKKNGPRRGRTTTPEERALAANIQRRLHALGVRSAKVTAVATKPGQGAGRAHLIWLDLLVIRPAGA